jgi:peptide/nickel transport system substrate-binding protein
MHRIAPGVGVSDNGQGAFFTGPWSEDLVRGTLLDERTGMRYRPDVTTGPYKFVSYDADDRVIHLTANDLFLGQWDGIKPLIRDVFLRETPQALQQDWLQTGMIDLLIQVSGGEQINAALNMVDEGAPLSFTTYNRNGYGRILFHCDWGPTQFPEVRRALAWCLDRDEFNRLYTMGYGEIVHSRIGAAQWMYLENRAVVDAAMIEYTLNITNAEAELVNGGWIYNAQGGAYTSGVRHKRLQDGTYMPLHIFWFSPDSNEIGATLSSLMRAHAESIGFSFQHDFGSGVMFGDVLAGRHEQRYNMVNGGVGFAVMDVVWYYYRPDPADFGTWNGNWIIDHTLNDITQDMAITTPGDKASFFAKWMEFVKHYNAVLPSIPLYSDIYFDFFNEKLIGYRRTALYPWHQSMLRAAVVD